MQGSKFSVNPRRLLREYEQEGKEVVAQRYGIVGNTIIRKLKEAVAEGKLSEKSLKRAFSTRRSAGKQAMWNRRKGTQAPTPLPDSLSVLKEIRDELREIKGLWLQ